MINSNISDFSSLSTIRAKVDLYLGSTLVKTCTCSDVLQDFVISREGDLSKFFGFGVCHSIKINFIDLYRALRVNQLYTAEVGLGDGTIWDNPYPTFHITEVSRNEDNNTITATAYDQLHNASKYTIADLALEAPYTLSTVVTAICTKLGIELGTTAANMNLSYPNGANFVGDESLREILDDIAEMTQTIYYINHENKLIFKQLNKDSVADLVIHRTDYYEMHTQTPRKLVAICSATELGDNIESRLAGEEGVVQYIRENPFLTNRTDIADILDDAMLYIGGIEVTQFDCDWDGDYRLEIGDKIELITEDGGSIISYLLSDSIEFDGTYNQLTEWKYTDNDNETPSNPTTIGEKINQTFARVDKVNKEISLVTKDVSDQKEQISQIQVQLDSIDLIVEENLVSIREQVETNTDNIGVLQVTANSIEASVREVETKTNTSIEAIDETLSTIINESNFYMTEEEVTIAINKTIDNGIDKVTTTDKQYTFDDSGLNITSSDSEISTQITEDGMKVYKSDKEVLIADNTGVTAKDLRAVTYLIIGECSRLEDRYGRTACFWIGD